MRRQSRSDRRRVSKQVPTERRRSSRTSVKITTEKKGGNLTIFLENEFVAETCFEAKESIERLIHPQSVNKVVVDLKGVPFIDSTALGVLVDLKKELDTLGIDFVVANPSKQVRWLIDLMLLDKVLRIV
ncbi:STAS domain-containing protein [Candidatus Sumerlaeota bacterium]|nr:STAS domain-containing protein [Candidatus Sumerlaeota bacterium]